MTPRSTGTSDNAATTATYATDSLLANDAARKSNVAVYEAYILVVNPVLKSPTHPAWTHPR